MDTARVIGAPTDYGANRRGVDMGPSAIRYAGLDEQLASAGVEVEDAGDLVVPRVEERDPGDPNARFLEEVAAVSGRLAEAVEAALADGAMPVVLGGDHSIAPGTLRGASASGTVGVLWFDAHGDYNTPETTPSGNVHGMAMAAALGVGPFEGSDWADAPGVTPEHVALVGVRDLDEGERRLLGDGGPRVYTMSDVDERGISTVVDEALSAACAGVDAIHVSLDLDWLDPKEAPGVGTPVRGGATYREAHYAMEAVAAHAAPLRSLELVEVNPVLDEHNETARLACELAASALGKRIL